MNYSIPRLLTENVRLVQIPLTPTRLAREIIASLEDLQWIMQLENISQVTYRTENTYQAITPEHMQTNPPPKLTPITYPV